MKRGMKPIMASSLEFLSSLGRIPSSCIHPSQLVLAHINSHIPNVLNIYKSPSSTRLLSTVRSVELCERHLNSSGDSPHPAFLIAIPEFPSPASPCVPRALDYTVHASATGPIKVATSSLARLHLFILPPPSGLLVKSSLPLSSPLVSVMDMRSPTTHRNPKNHNMVVQKTSKT